MKEGGQKLISADMDGLLKADGEPGQQRVTALRWQHNGKLAFPQRQDISPSLSRRRPCQAAARARLVQQSRNKTTLINAN